MIHGLDGKGHGRCAVRLNIEDIVRDAGLSTASPVQYTLRMRQRIEPLYSKSFKSFKSSKEKYHAT